MVIYVNIGDFLHKLTFQPFFRLRQLTILESRPIGFFIDHFNLGAWPWRCIINGHPQTTQDLNPCFKRQILGSRWHNGARFGQILRLTWPWPTTLTSDDLDNIFKRSAILLSIENHTSTVFLSYLFPKFREFKDTPCTMVAILDFSRKRVFAMGGFVVFFCSVIRCHQWTLFRKNQPVTIFF